jgi:two-component system, cell cycle sensor histidine kinase and response regulator CckA
MKQKTRVLYAEDSPLDADLTRTHFEISAPQIELEIVDTGEKCLARLKGGQYDVLLLDHHLPDMDAIDILRTLADKGSTLPVVTVTGVGDESLVIQMLRLGAVDYVPKHGDYLQRLPAVLENAVTEAGSLHERAAAIRRSQGRILYVEHHAADIDLTVRHFAETAPYFTLEVVHSATAALDHLQKSSIDLVLTDLRMPAMHALDLLKETKRRGFKIPFIIITGQGEEEEAVAALKLGAYDYIVKREGYRTQLPHAIENAIARAQLLTINRQLQGELLERQRAEAENARLLAETSAHEQFVHSIVANVPGVVWETTGGRDDPYDQSNFVSEYVESMLGYSVQHCLSTKNFWLSIVHPEDKSRMANEAAEWFSSRCGGRSQFRCIARDGHVAAVEVTSTVKFDDNGNPVGLRGVTMDVTAKAKLEERLQEAQRMESIGRLAGGVAHDFNNLLTVINGYADMSLLDADPQDPVYVTLTEIRRAGQRAAELTNQLLALSRRQLLQPRSFSLNTLIEDGAKTLQRLLGEDIEVVWIGDPELGQVKADPGQMNQVILNLAINARDAMPRGGTLTLETRNTSLDESYANMHLSLEPGAYVMLGISDTGHGMDAETLSRVFEPFFTTKEVGRGTGLGLATVYGIIKQSGGSIWVYSEPGHGTTFKIYLPRVDEPVSQSEDKPVEHGGLRGSEAVLVVEDDESVRKLTCTALRKYGYEIIEAANAGEALLACEKRDRTLRLMITDVVMPQMSGRELADRLRQLRPEMKVLYMSGYTDDAIVRHGLLDPAVFFLQKPFTPSALAQKVRQVLDQQ